MFILYFKHSTGLKEYVNKNKTNVSQRLKTVESFLVRYCLLTGLNNCV